MESTDQIKFGTTRNQSYADGEMVFRTMRRKFKRVVASYPGELYESFYVFGGRQVRLRIVGRQLAKHIVLPISHLRTQGQSGAPLPLTIDIWDGNGMFVTNSVDLSHENVECYETTLKSPDGRFIGQRLPSTISCLDRQRSHIVASIAWNDRISNYERAKPLARLLLEWHTDHNIQVIHAALVARNGQGVLVAGKRGAGKSTFSLACSRAGFDYVGEDFVGIERRAHGSFVGHSLYNSVFLEAVLWGGSEPSFVMLSRVDSLMKRNQWSFFRKFSRSDSSQRFQSASWLFPMSSIPLQHSFGLPQRAKRY